MIWLSSQPQWTLVLDLLRNRLLDASDKLEHSDEKNFRFEQGRILELRNMLQLEGQAKSVLEKARTPVGLSAIE